MAAEAAYRQANYKAGLGRTRRISGPDRQGLASKLMGLLREPLAAFPPTPLAQAGYRGGHGNGALGPAMMTLMTKEVPLQFDMFSGELVDNRTRTQKLRDEREQALRQGELFSQREMAQFGVNPRPQIPLSPHTTLVLIGEDPRTPEEKERDRQREIERLTYRMPGILDENGSEPPDLGMPEPQTQPDPSQSVEDHGRQD